MTLRPKVKMEITIMNRLSSLILLLLACSQFPASASDTYSANHPYKAAQREAASRYAADRKVCADESSSSARMTCLRDAKAEYTKALAEAKQVAAADGYTKPRANHCA